MQLMTTVETMRVHNALTAPLPPVAVVSGARTPAEMTSQATTDDDQLGETAVLQSLRHMQVRYDATVVVTNVLPVTLNFYVGAL